MRIYSYFSIPTDLAAAMRDWPEFVSGEEYSVKLKDPITLEHVIVQPVFEEDGAPYLSLIGDRKSKLFEKVVGRVILELQPHTDNLRIENFS